jgi:PAS domain S-box-containing protein
MDLSEYVFEALRKDEEFILYRGRSKGVASQVLMLWPIAEYAKADRLKRLENEYSLKEELDPSWATRPIGIATHWDRTVLILQDPGGLPLDHLLRSAPDASATSNPGGQPLDIALALRLAICISAAIGALHQRGIIHKDIKPANILADSTTGQCWLTGFGIASRLPRERQPPGPPEFIAGTLPYMSPEQTGRMNRSIDSRSDLYAFGVTLYELLTGRLPFLAADPMEWVHAHIARQPVPPDVRSKTVPRSLSAIVVKLLAKTAEERYQTAAGLERDLRRCLDQWDGLPPHDPFPLGQQDTPDRLRIPEKLYGREQEIDTLLASFDHVIANGRPELVLVSGYSGIGKSSVVNELHKVLVPPRGLLASGKFDQYKRDIPYSTLAQAFQSLVRPLLAKSEVELSLWRDALREALGPNGLLMVNLVPELKPIIGEQPAVPDLPPQDAKARFQLVFRRFVGVFARPEHPLALFLDDLQWLDAATLDFLEDLLSQPDGQHLMLIGAYRDNEVDSTHPLWRKLDVIRKAGAPLHELVLAALTSEDLGLLLVDTLHCETERARPLADLVHEKTAGNPFFAIQFISALAEEGLLTFDHGVGGWSWDVGRIHGKGYTDNVVDLLVRKLNRLPVETQRALEEFACLGNRAAISTLSIVHGTSEEKLTSDLWEAERLLFIERSEGFYWFLHDRVQEAAYSQIPAELRPAAHLRIGRLLAAQTPPENREEAIFEIVNQLNRGATLITAQEEREELSELNLIAGKRAKASTAYTSALAYLVAGAALLVDNSWDRRHELTFALELNRAECEFLTSALPEADQRLVELSNRAQTTGERAAVACLWTDVYTTLGQTDRAVAVCLDYLRYAADIDWTPHPTDEETRREYQRIWKTLGNRTIEALIDLPLMDDAASLATMDVLTKLLPPASYTDANLGCMTSCRAVSLSLERGNCAASCFAYSNFSRMTRPRFGDYEAGYRLGELGYELVERGELKRFEASTYLCFGLFVLPWTKHVRVCRDLLQRALEIANRNGDLMWASYTSCELNSCRLFAGDPLTELQREAERGFTIAEKAGFGLCMDGTTTVLALSRTLRGLTPEFGHFDDSQHNELQFEDHLSSQPHLALVTCRHWVRKLQARYLAGDYAAALDALLRAEQLLWTSTSFFEEAEYHFYGALLRAALSGSATPDGQEDLSSEASAEEEHLEALDKDHKRLALWAEHCPENFENRAALVGAEIARIEGREREAARLYEEAIRSAQTNGFVHNEALANELAARFYRASGFEKIANTYLRDARYGYLRWGAIGKVRQLDELYPYLKEEELTLGPTATIRTSAERLDLATVIKVSQAVSGEIVLEKLIDTLMRAAIEHAGAERGLLILPEANEFRVEAEASTGADTVKMRLRGAPRADTALAESVVHYVIRTQEIVILDDASAQNPFSADAYIRRQRARSILCLPLVNQARLIAVLYLENNLAPHVFTPTRIAVLKLLVSQAAISLENTRLYRGLEERKEALLRSETYLSEAQKLSHTGSFGWDVMSGKIYWSEESFRLFGYDLATEPTLELILERTHPEDRSMVRELIDRVSDTKKAFDFEQRLLMPDRSVKHFRVVGHPSSKDGSGTVEFVGAVTDITERKLAERNLREKEVSLHETQAELAHVSRLTTMGELAASIAHEVNQPLVGVVTNASAGLRFLADDSPDLVETREALRAIIRDGNRAADVVSRVRGLFKKARPTKERLNINQAIEEVVILTQGEARRNKVRLRTELAANLPSVMGDRVQIQQVVMNLILNGVEAMSAVEDGKRELVVRTQRDEGDQVRVTVQDSGIGIDPLNAERIFDAFHTTKPGGMGMGLSISRSIIESHGGRLWVTANDGPGATFQFTI